MEFSQSLITSQVDISVSIRNHLRKDCILAYHISLIESETSKQECMVYMEVNLIIVYLKY